MRRSTKIETEPLIYTTLGNIPIADVDTHVEWQFGDAGPDGVVPWIRCRVYRTLKATGEIVADGSYNYITQGLAAMADAATF